MYLNHQIKTAVLIFANSSQEEAKHKSIASDGKLFDALTNKTLKTVEKSQLPYFHFSEKQQIGSSFGERFSNAIQAVFDKGYEHIITIGNDSPQLMASHILKANEQLQSKKFVLGPTTDGGFYLMGLHNTQFDASAFKNLAWQTSSLLQQLQGLVCKQAKEIVLLEHLFDIDTVNDIKAIVAYTYNLPELILMLLLQLLDLQKQTSKKTSHSYSSNYFTALRNKGSPMELQS